jgi:hypothetical protein
MTTTSEHPFTPPGTTQPGLLDGEEMAIDPTAFAGAHRIELDAASWVEHIPGWLTGSGQLPPSAAWFTGPRDR